MGVRILHNSDDTEAVLYDSVSGIPLLTPLFHDDEHRTASSRAEQFERDCLEHFTASDLRRLPAIALREYRAEWSRTKARQP